MSDELKILKKKLLYRASYRGTKEMDILMTNFVKKHINSLDLKNLKDLETFLKLDDEVILEFYNSGNKDKRIENNLISEIFGNFKL